MMPINRRDVLGLLLVSSATAAHAGEAPMHAAEAEVRSTIVRYAEAWLRGDRATMVDCYHDNFTLHYFGSNALSGDHVGKAASLATLAEFSRRTSRKLKAVVTTMAGPDRGGLIVREVLGAGDAAVEMERLFIYAVRDGHLSECWVYDADQARIDRLIGRS
jgi:ketosteroid isomerase-like protein